MGKTGIFSGGITGIGIPVPVPAGIPAGVPAGIFSGRSLIKGTGMITKYCKKNVKKWSTVTTIWHVVKYPPWEQFSYYNYVLYLYESFINPGINILL